MRERERAGAKKAIWCGGGDRESRGGGEHDIIKTAINTYNNHCNSSYSFRTPKLIIIIIAHRDNILEIIISEG